MLELLQNAPITKFRFSIDVITIFQFLQKVIFLTSPPTSNVRKPNNQSTNVGMAAFLAPDLRQNTPITKTLGSCDSPWNCVRVSRPQMHHTSFPTMNLVTRPSIDVAICLWSCPSAVCLTFLVRARALFPHAKICVRLW